VDELEEYAENIREARAAAPERRTSGCGCVGWGVGAIVLLLLADGVLHIWFPLLFVLLMLIVAGMALTLLINAIRSRGAARGPFDPRNVDWHPLAVVRRARREPIAAAAMRRSPPPATTPPAAAAAAAGIALADPPAAPDLAPDHAPDDAGPAATAAPWPPEAPEAPGAPEAPDWA
jgi:hypothetical protein